MSTRLSLTEKIFLVVAAITSVTFLFVVESYNDLTLDDVGFALAVQKWGIIGYVKEMYLTWQGRFMGFILNGIQMKSYLFFKNMMPFSTLMYILNIFFISKAINYLFRLNALQSVLFSIILFQLYVYSMLDISSYFWMCTKGYTLMMTMSVYALALLISTKELNWRIYIISFFIFAFLGCSYEIFAPLILVIMVLSIVYQFVINDKDFKMLLHSNRLLLFSFFVTLVFFVLMLIAPGNWVRMNVHSVESKLNIFDFGLTVIDSTYKLLIYTVMRFYYYFFAGILIMKIISTSNMKSQITKAYISKKYKLIIYLVLSAMLILLSVILNTYAVGNRIELRAFNHVSLIIFILLGLVLSNITFYKKSKFITNRYVFNLIFAIISLVNVYAIVKNISELDSYKKSSEQRMTFLVKLNNEGNKKTIQLEKLDAAYYHSVDDIWKTINPKITDRVLLKPNEVSDGGKIGNFYNRTFKEYYKLNFDIKTDISCEIQ